MVAGPGPDAPDRYRFGRFELDVRSGELRRDGVTIQLQEQPLQVLLLLIERADDVVTRDELRRHVWREETFVDFEGGLNSIVKRLREALGDIAERPVFIQTLPRRGYRFLVRAEAVHDGGATKNPVPSSSEPRQPVRPFTWHPRSVVLFTAAALAVTAIAVIALRRVVDRRSTHGDTRLVRLAVLPFENLTGSSDQQFFADGLHEEMIFRLGRMHPRQLTVIARPSVMRYRETPKAIITIARELGVDFVLEGSVRQAGDRLRVTAQLIRAQDQSHLWTETYDRTWRDIFAVQSDVGARVADALAVELLPSSQAAASAGDVSPAAYEHYLKGRFYWNQRTRDPSAQLARAIEQFKLAIAAQPNYALAFGGLADAYNSIFFANPAVGDTPHFSARDALRRALQLDPRLASAHSTLAWTTMHFERDLADAERSFDRALELDPTDSLTRHRHAHLLAIRGRLREARQEADTARQSDPLSASIASIQGWLAFYDGDVAAATLRMKDASDLEGDPTRQHVFNAYVHAIDGDCQAASVELRPWAMSADALRMGEAVFARARCDGAAATNDLQQELLTRGLTYSTTMFHLARGEMDAFYEWLNRAIDEHFPESLYLALDPVFSRERHAPRFEAAMRRAGLR